MESSKVSKLAHAQLIEEFLAAQPASGEDENGGKESHFKTYESIE